MARMVVGLVSDTHGLLRPEAIAALRGTTLIVHAGDVGGPDVLEQLARLAPVVAVRGNNDTGTWARRLPTRATHVVGTCTLLVVHDRKALREPPVGVDVVVSGHSHRPSVIRSGGVLYVNPGSAGPRRFSLPVTVARLHPTTPPQAEILPLEVAAARAR